MVLCGHQGAVDDSYRTQGRLNATVSSSSITRFPLNRHAHQDQPLRPKRRCLFFPVNICLVFDRVVMKICRLIVLEMLFLGSFGSNSIRMNADLQKNSEKQLSVTALLPRSPHLNTNYSFVYYRISLKQKPFDSS